MRSAELQHSAADKPVAKPWGYDPTAWTIDGRVMHVTRPPTINLVNLVMTYSPIHVVFGTLRDDVDRQFLTEQVMDKTSPIENDVLHDVADQLVSEWFGMPRWTVQEIWWRVLGNWATIDGELTMRGVELMELPPARATNTARALLTKWAAGNDNTAEELRHDLTTEPPRIQHREVSTAATEEAVEAAAFDWNATMALMKQHQQ